MLIANNDEIIHCAKTVMGEPEILQYMLKRDFGPNDIPNEHIHSFIQTENVYWDEWLYDRICKFQGTDIIDVIRTTSPNAIIGEETHYIGIIIYHKWRKILFMNSENFDTRKMKSFKRKLKKQSIIYKYSFTDISPKTDENTFQIHENDTFCQSWSIFLLSQVLLWRPIDDNKWKNKKTGKITEQVQELYPTHISSSMTSSEKFQFIKKYVFDIIMETHSMFNFDVNFQLETEFEKKMQNFTKGLSNALLR